MGAEYVAAAGIAAGAVNTISGDKRARKQERKANEAAAGERNRIAGEQSKLDAELSRKREKTALGIARANKRRTRSPVFSTEQVVPNQPAKHLGG